MSALPVARMYSEKGLNAMQLISLVCAPSTQCFAYHHANRAAFGARPGRQSDKAERAVPGVPVPGVRREGQVCQAV